MRQAMYREGLEGTKPAEASEQSKHELRTTHHVQVTLRQTLSTRRILKGRTHTLQCVFTLAHLLLQLPAAACGALLLGLRCAAHDEAAGCRLLQLPWRLLAVLLLLLLW